MQLPLRPPHPPHPLSFERHSQSEACVCVGADASRKTLTAAAAQSPLELGWQLAGGWNALLKVENGGMTWKKKKRRRTRLEHS